MSQFSPKSSRKSSRASGREAGDDVTATLTTKDRFTTWQQNTTSRHWRFAISAACVGIAASAVGLSLGIVDLWDRQVQNAFFQLRGPVEAPSDIVILAIDDESLDQGPLYAQNPERYADLRPIASWPWRREAYATVIDRLMGAGAKAVAIDITFPTPSTYGPDDDEAFAQALRRHGDRVVLAAKYPRVAQQYGDLFQPSLPLAQFREAGVQIGIINFLIEPDQKIHRLGQVFLADIAAEEAAILGAAATTPDEASLRSFAQATLQAAKADYPKTLQENIFFYGPKGTFEQVPFWQAIDNDIWRDQLGSGAFFEDKIVIIGTTSPMHHDTHGSPFSETLIYPDAMPGVEILANSVATLEADLSPYRLIKQPHINALIVLGLGLAVAVGMSKTEKPQYRLLIVGGTLVLWTSLSYFAFVKARTIIISGAPIVAIATIGLMDFGVGFAADRIRRKRLRTTLARYVTSPLVQEIISQQDDFQDLLDLNQADIIGTVLRDRYRIVEVLGIGGFGETYSAQDTQRPGDPICVVKKLKIVSDNPKSHHLAQRLFRAEAVVLGELGEHNQIPRLLAYFEIQQTFYLVQEMVEGRLLRNILSHNRPLSQRAVIRLLRDLLPVVSFVHSKGVIHRDIKPSNIIRRKSDGRYVLIDFGAVKTITNKLVGSDTQVTSTVGIGTQGYMPSEQSNGMPTVRSDIYALGITAIEALTGKPPHALKRSDDGEIIWSHTVEDISAELSSIINQMVRYDFNKRYHSAQSVLTDLNALDSPQISESELLAEDAELDNDFSLGPVTHNQGTRPGVIATNEAIEVTQILPTDWQAEDNDPSEATTIIPAEEPPEADSSS
ncbi:MAG: protein kinase [Leptolyngbya foveolarum]|uniref:non-specific serine/threonine protein kinase n=1 Tax=Leptolyngbya foveolarum TaxID=47253 RepID=A0A2W4U8K0_9CYAN|nr:MAG: protein kinase [Leptolyngbya foveolarum]